MIRLLITSGRGPAECRIAVGKIVRMITKEAGAKGIEVTALDGPEHSQGHGPSSVALILEGDGEAEIAASWTGTIQWIAQSPVRPKHKRKNWFVSVSTLSPLPGTIVVKSEDVVYEAFRAGGPGGQHQNTTDSAVRAIHKPTNTRVVVREERSQHRNRAIALERISEVLALQARVREGKIADEAQRLHDALERGNPVRVLRD